MMWKEHLEHRGASGNSVPAVTAGSSLRDPPGQSFPLAIRNPRAMIFPGNSVGRSSSLTPHLHLSPLPTEPPFALIDGHTSFCAHVPKMSMHL